MQPICNMILHRLHQGNGVFAAYLDGTQPNENQIRPNYLLMAVYDSNIMSLITEPFTTAAQKDVGMFSKVLYLKAVLNGVEI